MSTGPALWLAGALTAASAMAMALLHGGNANNAPVAAQAAPALHQIGPRFVYGAGREPVMIFPDGRRERIHSMLNVSRPLQFGEYLWNDQGVPQGEVWIRVDLQRQLISVFRAGHEIGTSVILYGSDGTPTPTGVFPVLEKQKDYHSRRYDAPMPYMMRLTNDGVALHASNVRRKAATHGCIGTPEGFASRMYEQVRVGNRVLVDQGSTPVA